LILTGFFRLWRDTGGDKAGRRVAVCGPPIHSPRQQHMLPSWLKASEQSGKTHSPARGLQLGFELE
jgi:hypothetical protein